MPEVSLVKLSSDECHKIPLVISQHGFRYWLGAIRQQAISWASVDLHLCRHIASLGHNELNILWFEATMWSSKSINNIRFSKASFKLYIPNVLAPLHVHLHNIIQTYKHSRLRLFTYINGLMQDYHICIANALEIPQSCSKLWSKHISLHI